MTQKEPPNPFYFLLMIACLLFTLTAVAYAVLPILEEKATETGNPPPPEAFRDALRTDGWKWLLWLLLGVIVFGLMSMGLDRLRRLQKERVQGKIPPTNDDTPPRKPQE